jgi:uncharacterized protein (DUF2461 family)
MVYFSDKTFRFLRALARNNSARVVPGAQSRLRGAGPRPVPAPDASTCSRTWPQVSGHFRADPRPVGGSLFRIHRDTRFANDKTPYKTHAGARLFHERHRK